MTEQARWNLVREIPLRRVGTSWTLDEPFKTEHIHGLTCATDDPDEIVQFFVNGDEARAGLYRRDPT